MDVNLAAACRKGMKARYTVRDQPLFFWVYFSYMYAGIDWYVNSVE